MDVVICGVTGFRNRGVEALVLPILSQMRERLPEAQLKVLTDSPDYDRLRIDDSNVIFLQDGFSDLLRSRIARWKAGASRYVRRAGPGYRKLIDTISNASLVIATGGDVFSSDYGAMQRHLAPLRVARRAGTPFVLLAQSIGPFKRDEEVDRFRAVADGAALISVRENISYDYVVSKLGLPAEKVHLTADPAFLLEPSPPDTVLKMHRYYGLDPERPTVALGVSRGIEGFANCDPRSHLQAWIRVVNLLRDELQANVLLVPHVQERSGKNDDRITATRIVRELNYSDRLAVAGLDHSASEFKGIISQCDLVVAERMHAAIAGLSSATPTAAIGYSIKAQGIIESLFEEPEQRANLLIPIESFMKDDSSSVSIRWAWENRLSLSEHLQNRLPEIKRRAVENFDLTVRCARVR